MATRFAEAGHPVALARRDAASLKKFVSESKQEMHAYGCDARKEQEVVKLFETVEAALGPLTVGEEAAMTRGISYQSLACSCVQHWRLVERVHAHDVS